MNKIINPEFNYLGNIEILKEHKIAFLCSRKYPSNIILDVFDWAIKMRDSGNCIISGFQSKLEKDVLEYLLKGKQPIIIVLSRSLKKQIEPEIKENIDNGRILLISPFSEDKKRITEELATNRNRFILNLADELYIPYISKGGLLDKLSKEKNDLIL